MSVFLSHIPPGAPVIVVLAEMAGCPACEEFHSIFVKVAESFAKRGLPVIRIDAGSQDPDTNRFMNKHGISATPTVVAATLYRGAVAKLEGVSTEAETRQLFEAAWAHNRPRGY